MEAPPSRWDGAVHLLDRVILWMAGAALLLMMLHISVDVASTLIVGAPVPLTNAIVTQYYMIAVAFLPLFAAELRNAHISVDLVVNLMPVRPRRVVDALTQLLGILIYSALAIQSWQLAMEKLERNSFLMEQASRVTTWPSYFIIPVGFGLIALLLAVRLACRLLGRPEPSAPIDKAITHVT